MKGPSDNPFPLALVVAVLGPAYLWWPETAGPALFCFLPVLLLFLAAKVRENSRRLDRLEHARLPDSAPHVARRAE